MESAVSERRSEPRQTAKALDIERATLGPGCLVAVLDVSVNGAQVQSERVATRDLTHHARLRKL